MDEHIQVVQRNYKKKLNKKLWISGRTWIMNINRSEKKKNKLSKEANKKIVVIKPKNLSLI